MIKSINRSTEFSQLEHNMIWLSKIIYAFDTRFDELNQENPLAPDRIFEMHEAMREIYDSIKNLYPLHDGYALYPIHTSLYVALKSLIDLNRNATINEIHVVGLELKSLSDAMVKATQRLIRERE